MSKSEEVINQRLYEDAKADLRSQDLTEEEYAKEIKELAERLGL